MFGNTAGQAALHPSRFARENRTQSVGVFTQTSIKASLLDFQTGLPLLLEVFFDLIDHIAPQ